MSSKTRSDVAPFFGNHGGSHLFYKAFIERTSDFNAINEKDVNDIRTNFPHAYSIMRACDYDNKGNMGDNDIHYEFTDFIINTALYLRYVQNIEYNSDSIMDMKGGGQAYDKLLADIKNNPDSLDDAMFANLINALFEDSGLAINDGDDGMLHFQSVGNHTQDGIVINLYKVPSDCVMYIKDPADNEELKIPGDAPFGLEESENFDVQIEENFVRKIYLQSDSNIIVIDNAICKFVRENTGDNRISLIDDDVGPNGLTRAGMEFHKNVFTKWNSLSDEAKNFYSGVVQLYKASGNSLEEVPQKDYYLPLERKTNYTIMLKNTPNGLPVFAKLIPKYSRDIFGDIWYTNNDGKHVKLELINPIVSEDVLRIIFVSCLYNLDFGTFQNAEFPEFPTNVTNKIFNINVDRFVQKRFMQIQDELKNRKKFTGKVINLADKNIWHVVNGKLSKKEDDAFVSYEFGDEGAKKSLKKSNKCFSTFANDKDCTDYITNCLLKNDSSSLAECAKMWKSGNFYSLTVDDIKNVNPHMAARTLQKFGFRTISVRDSSLNMKIDKFETVDHWIKEVLQQRWGQQKDLEGETLQSILENNDNVLNYLSLLVDYVNSNPSIINKNVFGKSDEANGVVKSTEYAMKLGIPLARKKKTSKTSAKIDFYNLTVYMQRLRDERKNSFVNSPSLTSRNQFNTPFSLPFQYGGNVTPVIDFLDTGEKPSASFSLFALIQTAIEGLRSMGKTIDDNATTEIQKKLQTMMNVENEMIRTLVYLEEYRYLIELFKEYDHEDLTLDKVRSLVDNNRVLLDKYDRQEDSIIKILKNIQNKLNEANDEKDYHEAVF